MGPPARLTSLVLALGLGGGCAGRPTPARPDETRLRAEVAQAEEALPRARADHIVGDGFGPTSRDAVLDARRAVSEQITANVESEIEGRQSEVNGKGEAEAFLRVRTTSAFEHGELLQTLGVVERPGGFAARVVLDRDRAAEVYAKELAADRERLAKLGPIVDEALVGLDSSILLSSPHVPAEVLAEMNRKAAILRTLGRPADVEVTADARALEKRAAAVRAKARLRLRVEGRVTDALRRAAVGEVGAMLADRGCRVVEDTGAALPPDAPVGLVTVRLTSRDHEERDLKWRYLGMEVQVVDARNGRSVMQFVGMPDLVHGGGPTWARADEATARRLKKKLRTKGEGAFGQITCR